MAREGGVDGSPWGRISQPREEPRAKQTKWKQQQLPELGGLGTPRQQQGQSALVWEKAEKLLGWKFEYILEGWETTARV